jgi:catechol 2,3-dioxygenase-like lactoylglutathione lyase family enzyme
MKVKCIKEVCLYVKNLYQSEDFYRRILGFPVIGRAENRHVFFRAGTSVLLCFNPDETRHETKLPAHFSSGWQHIAFEVSPEDYQETRNNLIASGIDILQEVQWGNTHWSFYFRDPDQHLLEVVTEGLWD